ncbi:MAG: hypothetical protein IKE22_11895 [Atopobiaceae bacterium]|nr:hypothetical protein [Atopobiaceae bacterium]
MEPTIMVRRLLCVVLSASMVLSSVPVVVLADDSLDPAAEDVATDVPEDLTEGEGEGENLGGASEGGEATDDAQPEDGDSQKEGEGAPSDGSVVTDDPEAVDPAQDDLASDGEATEDEKAAEEAGAPEEHATKETAEAGPEVEVKNTETPANDAEVSTTAARRDISKARVSAISSQAYTGSAVKPRPTVRYGTATLALGTDYTLSYKNNTKPGTATVTVTGRGAYAGTKSATFRIVTPSVSYRTHVQNVGWQGWRKDGAMSGTSGRALRLEGINVKLTSKPVSGGIAYRTHVQNIGWQGWRSDGAMSGTSGRSLRLEAIQVKLTGKMAERYDVWYRVHCENIGWMGWARNGQSAGSAGYAYRLEGIQIALVPKGKSGPGATYKGITQSTSQRFRDGSSKDYSSYVGTYKRVVHSSNEMIVRWYGGIGSIRELVITSISGNKITFKVSYCNWDMANTSSCRITGTIRDGRVDFTWKDVGYCHDEGTGYLKLQNGQVILNMKVTKKDLAGRYSLATNQEEITFKKGTQHFYD